MDPRFANPSITNSAKQLHNPVINKYPFQQLCHLFSYRNLIDEQNVIVEERYTTASGEPAIRKYQRGRLLGKGGFARCYEFVNLENKKVSAAKIVSKSTLTKVRAKQKVRV